MVARNEVMRIKEKEKRVKGNEPVHKAANERAPMPRKIK